MIELENFVDEEFVDGLFGVVLLSAVVLAVLSYSGCDIVSSEERCVQEVSTKNNTVRSKATGKFLFFKSK